MLDLAGLATFLGERHTADLFRVETLDRYRSTSDGLEFDRFCAGKTEPDRESKSAWLAKLAEDTAAGRRWRRLRVLRTPLTDYVRYSCEWGYPDNGAAGEVVRVLDLSTGAAGLNVLTRIGDFYLVDDRDVAEMHYDDAGAFRSATPVAGSSVEVYRAIAHAAWEIAEPFGSWWSGHPECHRTVASR